jgi:hypothetical protein
MNQRRKSVALAKMQAVGAAPKAASAAKNREGPAATAAVIAGGVQDGEAGLQILRQRRPSAVLQEETRRPLPRLLQEALWLGLAGQENRAHSEDGGCQVVWVKGVDSDRGQGSSKGPAPQSRVGSAFATRSNQRLDRNQRLRAIRYQAPNADAPVLSSVTGHKVALAPSQVITEPGAPSVNHE